MSDLPRKHEKLSYFFDNMDDYAYTRETVQSIKNIQRYIQFSHGNDELQKMFTERNMLISTIPNFWSAAVS